MKPLRSPKDERQERGDSQSPIDDRRGRGGANDMMFKQLADAICQLSCVLRDGLKQRQAEFEWFKAGLATKADIAAVEGRIIKALGERVDAASLKDLTKAADGLEAAVEANQPR